MRAISDALFGNYYVEEVLPSQDPFTTADIIYNSPLFDYVEFDALGHVHTSPNDPLYASEQWNLPQIGMPEAWDITTGSNSIILGIIDTGIDYNHEDLDGNIWHNPNEEPGDANGDGFPGIEMVDDDGDGLVDEDSQGRQPGEPGYTNDLVNDDDENGYEDDFYGWDFEINSNDNDPFPHEGDGHGTCVAGIATAETNNNLGIAGIAGGCSGYNGAAIMILKYENIAPESLVVSTVAQGLRYAAKNGASIINMSIGWENRYGYFRDAVDSAANVYDCVVVASAGNEDGPLNYPAKYDSAVIAVGATIEDGSRWFESAFGPELDVMAPGGLNIIPTTDITGDAGYVAGDYLLGFGGTSASAPHVAGVAALIRSIYPELTWQQVKDMICFSAMKVPQMGGNERTDEYGYGIVNAHNALLLSYAYDNKSLSPNATAYNNGRRLIRDDNNRFHLVFESGGEIFYRRSNVGGTSWEDPTLLSNLRGAQLENQYPSITGTSDKQFVVSFRITAITWYLNPAGRFFIAAQM